MKRWLGPVVVAAGVLVFLIGVTGTFGGGDDIAIASDATTSVAASVTSVPVPSSTLPTTSSTTTTTLPATTTTTVAPTTTQPVETVEEFLMAFSAALDAGDRDYVFARLHPEVIVGWGEDLCSAWVDREIMELNDYTYVSLASGPAVQVVTTPTGTATISDYFSASVSFVFRGETFSSEGGFALIDGKMYWLGQCR